MLHRPLLAASCATACLLTAQPVSAGAFDVTATVNGVSQSRQYNKAEDALASTSDAGLQALIGGYTGVETASLKLDFRGVGVSLIYPTNGSALLQLDIPAINVQQSFQGANRNESESLLKDYFKKNPDLLERLQKALVKSSPIDPVAGNPNSMMSRGVASDFSAGLVTAGEISGTATHQAGGVIGFMPTYTKIVANGATNPRDMDSDSASLPLSYTRKFDKPGQELSIYVPLSQSKIEGGKAYDLGMSGTYRNPVSDAWFLAFTGGLRATGSRDLGSGVAMGNVTVTSSYIIPGKEFSYTIGNMIGWYSALKVKVNDVAYKPDIHNTVFRNGVLVEQHTNWQLAGEPVTVEYSLVDTRFTGTELFNKNQQELGLTIGSARAANARSSSMRFGMTYLHAPHAKGFSASFGYWF